VLAVPAGRPDFACSWASCTNRRIEKIVRLVVIQNTEYTLMEVRSMPAKIIAEKKQNIRKPVLRKRPV
jgi:hypothetical protein